MNMSKEYEYATNVRAALDQRAPRSAWLVLFVVSATFLAFIVWASNATIIEVTRGVGKVIPSRQVQTLETLDGGIVAKILVREGDVVKAGQVLVEIDDTSFSSKLGELQQRLWALEAEIARLVAEAEGKDKVRFSAGLRKAAPWAVLSETDIFNTRRQRFGNETKILAQKLAQTKRQLIEMEARRDKFVDSLKPLKREVELTRDMAKRGVVPEIDLLRLERQLAEQSGELKVIRRSIERLQPAIAEARERLASATNLAKVEARERLAKVRAQMAVVLETVRAAKDRVARTHLRAPVNGTVNKVNVTTVGAVLQPGKPVMEIIPRDDSLLIEARIRPSDVAFIRPDNKAKVKLTAYDATIYGALDARVERISADTIADERGEAFYRVIVRTDVNHFEKDGKKLPIIPGMVGQVDITGGKKSILDYLLKPILKARGEALRER